MNKEVQKSPTSCLFDEWVMIAVN